MINKEVLKKLAGYADERIGKDGETVCEALGANVTHLRRVRIMNLRIGKLQPGQWREVTPRELQGLLDAL